MPFKGVVGLPISWENIEIPSTVIMCPHCRVKSHLTPMTYARGYRGKEAWVIQECDNCKQQVLTTFKVTGSYSTGGSSVSYPSFGPSPEEIFPYFRPIPDASLPTQVADDYTQAVLCFSAGAFDASVVMSRRAIETAAIMLGANPNDRLVDQIKHLASKGLEQSLVELATQIRLFGNVPAAHPDRQDFLRKVKREECADILSFLEAFLESVYIRPAKIEKLKSGRK